MAEVQQGVVGVQGPSPAGEIINARFGNYGEQNVSELQARYYEQALRKNTFSVANQAVVATTIGLAQTYTGLCLANPIGSGVNLALKKCSWMQSVIQATQIEGFALAYGFNSTTNVTLTAALVPQSTFIGSGAVSKAVATSSAASTGLPTAPVYGTFIGNTATATQNNPGGVVDLEGSVILPPGAFAVFVTPTQASVNGMWFSFQWDELNAVVV